MVSRVKAVVVALALVALAAPAGASGTSVPSGASGSSGGPDQPETAQSWLISPATEEGVVDGRPFFTYTVDPGDTVTDYLRVKSLADVTQVLTLYPSQAGNAANGDLVLADREAAPEDLSAWTSLDVQALELPPDGEQLVRFDIQVPADAEPGDYTQGIVTSQTQQVEQDDGQLVNLDSRLAARVYVRVNGDLAPQVEFTGLTDTYERAWWNPFGTAELSYSVRNTGNVRLRATDAVTAEGPFGIDLGGPASGPEILDLLPGSEVVSQPVEIPRVLALLQLTQTVELSPYAVNQGDLPIPPVEASSTVRAVYWPAVVLLALGLLVWVVRWRRRRRLLALATVRAARVEREKEPATAAPAGGTPAAPGRLPG